ncbi:MAG: ArsA family ATPase, partial [Gordonia sp. (in: high G+C Gram-positive bacteria)]
LDGFDDEAAAAAAGLAATAARIPRLDGPVDRVARLRRLGVEFREPTGTRVGTAAASVERVEGSGVDAVYEMRWHQPLPDPSALGLGRAGDDLLVTISGFRFPVRLPSVLRRCSVVGADWDADEMCVRFTPDPSVWPTRPTA